ncbi:hypothetical protein BKA62DRAFT_820989 [Auriculariales sp. MPI-PUGE-AT-0066]|nr:hypothetical protein BKA62DRAFT_820989 [Auriculariales sp. MPI-PUGE-AT-0066]
MAGLYVDIWEGVLDNLLAGNAKQTIASLSLTNRNMRLPSQRALFRCLKFTGRTHSMRPGTSREVVHNLRNESNSRLRQYVREVEIQNWLSKRHRTYDNYEPDDELALTCPEVLALLEHLPRMFSLKLSHVTLENDTLERLFVRFPNLTNVELGYCTWNRNDSDEDARTVIPHSVTSVKVHYWVPYRGGRRTPKRIIQIPPMLRAATALICPAQIKHLYPLAYPGLEQLLSQLAASKPPFLQLASLTIICPPADAASDIVSLLLICPMLKELSLDRRDYASRVTYTGPPSQRYERESIHSICYALTTTKTLSTGPGRGGLLPVLKSFTGSAEEAIVLLNCTPAKITHLELHRAVERLTLEGRRERCPRPTEAIDEIMNALKIVNTLSRHTLQELKLISGGVMPSARTRGRHNLKRHVRSANHRSAPETCFPTSNHSYTAALLFVESKLKALRMSLSLTVNPMTVFSLFMSPTAIAEDRRGAALSGMQHYWQTEHNEWISAWEVQLRENDEAERNWLSEEQRWSGSTDEQATTKSEAGTPRSTL